MPQTQARNRLTTLFRFFYRSFYILLLIILLALLIITPADAIHQALQNNQLYNVFVIAGCYFVTVLLAVLIYASRLYTTRSVLAAIPKTWIPVEKGDVGKSVRKMIVQSLTRSALVAWDARPRAAWNKDNGELDSERPTEAFDQAMEGREGMLVEETAPEASPDGNMNEKESQIPEPLKPRRTFFRRKPKKDDRENVTIPIHRAVWGSVSHAGWSSPTSDMPNLQYTTVILELPHLIEAKAVSLAPIEIDTQLPSMVGQDLLRRPIALGLRDYISQLTRLGVLLPNPVVTEFIEAYESARFAAYALSETSFNDLMKLFADVLRFMLPLDPSFLELDPQSDIDDDASSSATYSRSRSLVSSRSGRSGSAGTIRTAPSRKSALLQPYTTQNEKIRKGRDDLERRPSAESFAQTRRPYAMSQASNSSLGSASGSVIRLKLTASREDLPYEIQTEQ